MILIVNIPRQVAWQSVSHDQPQLFQSYSEAASTCHFIQ